MIPIEVCVDCDQIMLFIINVFVVFQDGGTYMYILSRHSKCPSACTSARK